MKIRKKIKRFLDYINGILFPVYKMDEKEQVIYDIILKLTSREDSEYSISPISERYYIINKKLDYKIIIAGSKIRIGDSYSQLFPQEFNNILINLIKQAVENNILKFEEQMFISELQLLSGINNIVTNRLTLE